MSDPVNTAATLVFHLINLNPERLTELVASISPARAGRNLHT